MPQILPAGNSFGPRNAGSRRPPGDKRSSIIYIGNPGPAVTSRPSQFRGDLPFDGSGNGYHVNYVPNQTGSGGLIGAFVWAGNRLFHERTRGQWRKTSAVG